MKKSRPYYQYMLDLADNKVSYYSTDDISQVIFDLLDDGDVDEAMSACQKGLAQHPNDEHLELIEAKILLHQHRWDEAERLLDNNPDAKSPFGLGIRFGIDVQTKDPIDAFDALMYQLQHCEVTALEFVEIIDELLDVIPHDMTAHYLEQAIKQTESDPLYQNDQYAEALGRIGALLMDCNRHSSAIPALEKALDIDAYDVYSWQDLARCQFQLQKIDECRNSCEMGLAIDPQNPLFHFILGYLLSYERNYADAIEHLEIARQYAEGKLKHEDLNLGQTEAEEQTCFTYEMLSEAYQMTDQIGKARECLVKLINFSPKHAQAYFRLAMLDLDLGDKASALKNIDEAIKIDPNVTSYQAFRVTLLTDQKQFDEALSALDKMIDIDPKSSVYLLAKAELALSLKHYEEADEAYRALLKLNPEDATSREMMRIYFESIGDTDALSKIK